MAPEGRLYQFLSTSSLILNGDMQSEVIFSEPSDTLRAWSLFACTVCSSCIGMKATFFFKFAREDFNSEDEVTDSDNIFSLLIYYTFLLFILFSSLSLQDKVPIQLDAGFLFLSPKWWSSCKLISIFAMQAERWGSELITEDVEFLDLKNRPFTIRSSEVEACYWLYTDSCSLPNNNWECQRGVPFSKLHE